MKRLWSESEESRPFCSFTFLELAVLYSNYKLWALYFSQSISYEQDSKDVCSNCQQQAKAELPVLNNLLGVRNKLSIRITIAKEHQNFKTADSIDDTGAEGNVSGGAGLWC